MATRFLRLPEVLSRTGFARSALYLAVANGDFPAQTQLAQRSVG
ncbi:MAG: AlpA family phage regulatory protein [Chromatiales bacterium]|nr:AlpA family phage regulatory protein [Chromatiales bacterium]